VAAPGDLVWRAGRSRLRRKKGIIERLDTAPPEGSVVICLDELGPQAAKSYPGQQPVHAKPRPQPDSSVSPAERAHQEIDYGRRGKGSLFGAFRPATGAALTHPYPGRGAANWADFLARVESWLPSEAQRVYAIVDNLQAHRATDVVLFSLAYPRWKFVFSAEVRGLPEPHRAVVEGPQEPGAEGPTVRELGGSLAGGGRGDSLLE
jgi:hypothetical protein